VKSLKFATKALRHKVFYELLPVLPEGILQDKKGFSQTFYSLAEAFDFTIIFSSN